MDEGSRGGPSRPTRVQSVSQSDDSRVVAAQGASPARAGQAATSPAVIDSGVLFGKGRELVILHAGVAYRLRITRQNKLILTK